MFQHDATSERINRRSVMLKHNLRDYVSPMSRDAIDASDPSSISSTLLERVRARRPEAWERLVDLYGPVVYHWCRRSGLGPEDAADVVQEVFTAVAVHVAEFRRDRPSDSFGAWLRTITRNKVRDHYRRRQGRPEAPGGTEAHEQLAEIGDPAEPSDPSAAGDDGLGAWLSRRGLDLVRAEFENRTWEAFWRTAVEGHAPAHVAEDLGMSVQAVYKAKSRVLRRLRQELDELL
jgi:RNA polymerase sigma-70 factor (ECF subfamily)